MSSNKPFIPLGCYQHIIDMYVELGNRALVQQDFEAFNDFFTQEVRYRRLQVSGRDCQEGFIYP